MFIPLRIRLVIGTLLGLAAVMGVGAYYQLNSTIERQPVIYSLSTSAGESGSERAFSFSALESPEPLPELSFVDGEGREMRLEAFEGQTVLLNIWATWCVPCRKEMPALDRLQAKLGGPEFQVVALSIDRDGLPVVKDFYEELGLQALGIYVDQSGRAAYATGAVGIPTTLLVGPDGRELGRTVGPAEWDGEEVVQFLTQHLKTQTGGSDGQNKEE